MNQNLFFLKKVKLLYLCGMAKICFFQRCDKK